MMKIMKYKDRSCNLITNNEPCSAHLNCPICCKIYVLPNAFDMCHHNLVNAVKCGKQCIINEVAVKNKTRKVLKNVSVKEDLAIGLFKFALKSIKIIQDCDNISSITPCTPKCVLETGELLVPYDSILFPNEEFRIIYELEYIGRDNFLHLDSSLDLSACGADHMHSRIDIKAIECDEKRCYKKENCSDLDDPCCSDNDQLASIVLIIDIKSRQAFDKCDYSFNIAEDGKFRIYNYVKMCDQPYHMVSFDYEVIGKYKLIAAEGVTGDECTISLFNYLYNSIQPSTNGTFTTPIGRFIDFGRCVKSDECNKCIKCNTLTNESCGCRESGPRSPYTIHYLKLVFVSV